MPGRDGFGLSGNIRALGPDGGGSVLVIAMTALGMRADRERMLRADFQACLLRPSVRTS
jgi:CheY-like chemotaxis protein